MKRKMALFITAFLFIAVGALCVMYDAKEAQAEQSPDAVIVLPDDSLMIVLFVKDTEEYLQSIRGAITVTITNNKMYHGDSAIVNNLNQIGYGVYPWQEIEEIYETDPDTGIDMLVPQYMYNLNLEPIGVDDLPHSQHIGKLIGIDTDAAKPAIVARKFLGEVYTVNCLVSQSAFDMYQVGDLELGDYVIVSFIDEIPDTTELNIAIVVDKVKKTW